jgi:hypothetical protein
MLHSFREFTDNCRHRREIHIRHPHGDLAELGLCRPLRSDAEYVSFHIDCYRIFSMSVQYGTIAFFSLGRGDDISALEPLIRFVDGHCTPFKIEICGRKGKQFTFPDTAPIEHLKGVK